MARDSDLLDRMYGGRSPSPPPRGAVGALPAVWLIGLVAAGAASCAVSVGLLIAAALAGPPLLVRWGVTGPEEWLLAVHDHSEARDGTAGCVLTGERVVRFDDRTPTASVDLRGAEVEVVDQRVEVRARGVAVRCPFAEGEDPEPFAARVRRHVRAPVEPPPLPEGSVPRPR